MALSDALKLEKSCGHVNESDCGMSSKGTYDAGSIFGYLVTFF